MGILGLVDVAHHIGMSEYKKEDYGQSLAKLGVGPGCYIVLPVLGPSTARDTVASAANFLGGDAWYNVTVRNDTQYFSDIDYYGTRGASGINFRSKNYDSIENLKKFTRFLCFSKKFISSGQTTKNIKFKKNN